MEKNKAKEAMRIMNRITKCESFLDSLKGRSYSDEFDIYYRGYTACELEEDMLQIIIKHYEDELEKLNEELKKL